MVRRSAAGHRAGTDPSRGTVPRTVGTLERGGARGLRSTGAIRDSDYETELTDDDVYSIGADGGGNL
jgi:hypothetical protein